MEQRAIPRREMLQRLSLAASALALCNRPSTGLAAPSLSTVQRAETRPRLGIGMYSYGAHWAAAKRGGPTPFHNALEFLEYAHQLGAGGVQVALDFHESEPARRFRRRAEELELYFEGQAGLPRTEADVERFQAQAKTAKEAGATVIRTACLGGRRYEVFDSAAAFEDFARRSLKSLELAEPVMRRLGLRLAVENHKDWRAPELLGMLRKLDSEHIGVCVDFGNSIALQEDWFEVIDAYAPLAVSTHVKDMAVSESPDGFLLSEVPLGTGLLDLAKMIRRLRHSAPRLRFNLEMITRDPLRIPCLTPRYWATLESVPARQLAHTLETVRKHSTALPRVTGLSRDNLLRAEDENVRKSLKFARDHLGL